MGNDCDPELRLRLGTDRYCSPADSDSSRSIRAADWFGNATEFQQFQQQQQQQQITIFYNGKTCVCDVTEIQARAIICMAMKEMQKERSTEMDMNQLLSTSQSGSSSSADLVAPQLIINPEHSMKRSLQRFLQKRKTRIDSASPYNSSTDYGRLR